MPSPPRSPEPFNPHDSYNNRGLHDSYMSTQGSPPPAWTQSKPPPPPQELGTDGPDVAPPVMTSTHPTTDVTTSEPPAAWQQPNRLSGLTT